MYIRSWTRHVASTVAQTGQTRGFSFSLLLFPYFLLTCVTFLLVVTCSRNKLVERTPRSYCLHRGPDLTLTLTSRHGNHNVHPCRNCEEDSEEEQSEEGRELQPDIRGWWITDLERNPCKCKQCKNSDDGCGLVDRRYFGIILTLLLELNHSKTEVAVIQTQFLETAVIVCRLRAPPDDVMDSFSFLTYTSLPQEKQQQSGLK